MNDEDINSLQNDAEWDFEAAERKRAPRGRGNRAIVAVGFQSEEFALVTAAARDRDQPVSQFIRQAALDKAHAIR